MSRLPVSRLSIAVLASVLAVGATVRADTFGGWQYTAPRGYEARVTSDHVGFTRQTGSTFCSISLFEARELDGSAAKESAFEWYNVVTHAFKATVQRRATTQTPQGVQIEATTATLVDADGNRYAAIHYVVMPPGMIGSVLLISPTAASLRACERDTKPFVASLAIDWTRFNDPEARVETPIGRWAVAGGTSREYTFAADGSYVFHSEATAGEGVKVMDEVGKYTVLANQLTLTPIRVTSAIIDHGVARPAARLPVEKTTYTWGKRYLTDTNEWLLVLTPRKATTRDGKLPANQAAYDYSDLAKPGFKFATQPGV